MPAKTATVAMLEALRQRGELRDAVVGGQVGMGSSSRAADVAEQATGRSPGWPGGGGAAPLDSLLSACSNDYLGLGRSPVSRETLSCVEGVPLGGTASRLVHATRGPHLTLEREAAAWVGQPAALLFSSGYAANLGVLGALLGPGDQVFSDRLNHASIIDGCRLSGAATQVFAHRDLDEVAALLSAAPPSAARWVVTESYFSMDGDSPNLGLLRALCDRHDAGLIVDEAHALGVFGPSGSGLCAAAGVLPDVTVGTFGKAVGSHGAFVAASHELIAWLWNRARSLVFSTATSPLLAVLTAVNLRRARSDDTLRAHLARSCQALESRLREGGVRLSADRHGPIFPVIFGSSHAALRAAQALRERGILAQAIRPPSVPAGTARLRVTVDAVLSEADLERLAGALIDAWEHACRP